jgi:hypothetical protein
VVVGTITPALVATAGLIAVIRLDQDPLAQATIYALWSIGTALYLGGRAYGLDWGAALRSRAARARDAGTRTHSSAAAASTPEAR